MRRLPLFFLLLFILSGCQASPSPTTDSPLPTPAPATRVLFIGNSLTFSNHLPNLLAQLTTREEKPLITDSVTFPLASLGFHWFLGTAAQKIRQGHWDFVVLQEFSTLPVSDTQATIAHFQKFSALARTAGARVIIFENWTTRSHSQDAPALAQTYAQAQHATGATLAPIGAAWQQCNETLPDLKLLADDRHPTLAGTYLAACVLYHTIYAAHPTALPSSLPGLHLSPAVTLALQQVADAATSPNPANLTSHRLSQRLEPNASPPKNSP